MPRSKQQFIENLTYYPQPTYEFNLPAGWSCPGAKECKVKVDRLTGKMEIAESPWHCYAAAAERFPGVRESRWGNMLAMIEEQPIRVPRSARYVRIHASGDFFSQAYFDRWLEACKLRPSCRFWAFTKSIPYWLQRLDQIPPNLVLTASYGGLHDDLIKQHDLKSARVFASVEDARAAGLPIDTNDALAMMPRLHFALIDNAKVSKGQPWWLADLPEGARY